MQQIIFIIVLFEILTRHVRSISVDRGAVVTASRTMNQSSTRRDKILKRSHIERQKEIKRRTINVPEMSSLPGTLDPVEFARTRTSEVLLLKQEIEQSRMSNSSRRVFQTLPRTMRRRAASFNVKRLPMRLRQRALDEIAKDPKGAPKQIKKPACRRRRRRPSNIKAEFERRSLTDGKMWLETHLWHAKRTHMIDIWGHRIAYKMNEKCLRACVRSSINGCFVRDISYNQVIPLDLLDTSKDPYLESNIINWNSANHEICEKPINSKGYLPGLGPVHFIMEHKAFVLIHPLIKNNLLLKSNALPHPSLPTCRHLCIIEAYGNESVSLFENVLGISPQTLEKLVRRESSGFTLSFEAVDPRIEPLELITVFDQKNAKKSILECNYTVPDGKIIVHDAALNKIRSAMRVPGNPIKEDPNWSRMPVILCYTPGNEFCPKQQPNTLKKGKTPGPKSGGSWILIVPSLWGRIIWRCIVGPNRKRGLQRVRVGGLEEACVVSREAGHPTFPNDYPGTAGYLVHLSSRLKELESKWLRTPPGKRINYKKQGMPEFFKVEYYLSLLGNPGLGQIHEEHIVRVFIQTEDRGIPEEGSLLFKIQNGSDPIGYITSGGYSQTFGRGVGFGVVRRSCIESYFTIDNENFDFIVNSSTVDTEREVESLTWFMMHLNGPMRPCRIRRSC